MVIAVPVAVNADAGNPIVPNTIVATAVDNGDTVTISVKGRWDWQSHGGDCNFDRAATGAGIIWNDLNGSGTSRGVNETQRVALSGTVAGATFKLKFKNPAGLETLSAFINASDTAAQLQAKLEAMPSIGAGNVSVSGGPGATAPWNIQFTGSLAGTNVNTLASSNKSGGLTVTITTPTTGVGPVYNGWLVENGGIRAYVGTQFASTDATGTVINPVDRMVHPVDIGDLALGDPGVVPQAYVDPDSNNPAEYLSWRGGCGKEPFADYPIGSWGYTTDGLGTPPAETNPYAYSHTYLKILPDGSSGLPDRVCVNFYDVHGGGDLGDADYQVPNSAKEVTVDLNGDNSIDTNKFNVLDTSEQGSNCITLINPAITTQASNSTFPAVISDTATLSGVPADAGGTITFKVYGPRALDNNTPACTTLLDTFVVNVTGPGNYNSGNFTPPQAGKYDWTAVYSGDPGKLILGASSPCGATNETSTVGAGPTGLTTNAGGPFRVDASGNAALTDTATLTGATAGATGTITFKLYGPDSTPATDSLSDCVDSGAGANLRGTATATVTGPGDYTSSPAITVNAAGKYHWTASYSGDLNNQGSVSVCGAANENPIVQNPTVLVVKTTSTPVIETGGTATFTIQITNNGDATLTNVHVDDIIVGGAAQPQCSRTAAQLVTDRVPGGSTFAAGDTYSYNCTVAGQTNDFTNKATVTGTPPVGADVTDDDTEAIDVIHPQIDVTKNPKTQSVPQGGTANFTIEVTNTGDVPLTNVVVSDALAPNCARTAAQTAALINTKYGHTTFGVGESFTYTCTLTNVQAAFTNVVTVCGDDQLNTTVCDNDNDGGGGIPDCPETARCGEVDISSLGTEQDFLPKDTGTLSGLVGTPGGTLTFGLFTSNACTVASQLDLNAGAAGKDLTATVTANGGYTVTAAQTLAAMIGASDTEGTFYWKVSYSGDAASGNAAITGACGTENFTVDNH